MTVDGSTSNEPGADSQAHPTTREESARHHAVPIDSQQRTNFTDVSLKSDEASSGANGRNNLDLTKKQNGQSESEFKKIKDGFSESRPGRFRHVVAILALSSIVLANMNRQAYNQALSRMVSPIRTIRPADFNSTADGPTTTTRYDEIDELLATTEPSTTYANDPALTTEPSVNMEPSDEPSDDLFDWNGKQISLLQTAFSWGYMPFMIPGGRLSEIYGAKWIVFLSGFGSALCSIVTPFLATYSFTLLVCSRILMGICQTGVSPALYALLTRWLTPDESSVYLAMIKVGVMIGFMAGSFINGFLSWRLTFYSVGFISILWSAMWAVCVTSTPDEHKFMSADELTYIKQSIGLDVVAKPSDEADASAKKKKQSTSAPWAKIITSPVVLAFIFTKFTVKLSTDTQSMQLPMYLKNVIRVSDKLNGPLNGANFAIQAVFTGMVAYTAKEMIVRKSFGMDKTAVRKLFQAIQNYGMGAGYVIIALSMDSLPVVCGAVMLISIASMFGSGGEAVTPVDLTRKYSASIMAIANSLANLSGIVLPPIVSFLLSNQLDDPDRWRRVWWFVSGAMMLGGTMFLLFVNARLQNFDDDEAESKQNGSQLTIGKARKSANCDTSQTATVIEMKSKVQTKGFDED